MHYLHTLNQLSLGMTYPTANKRFGDTVHWKL